MYPVPACSRLSRAGEENAALEALRALQYEGPPSEVMQNFKEQGNEAVQEKKWKDAREYYTKGLAVIRDRHNPKFDTPADPAAEDGKVAVLEEQLYSNRARCNLELRMLPPFWSR